MGTYITNIVNSKSTSLTRWQEINTLGYKFTHVISTVIHKTVKYTEKFCYIHEYESEIDKCNNKSLQWLTIWTHNEKKTHKLNKLLHER